MGPSGEPGEANPPKADESRGLGGSGTEGKAGEPAGGVEPQIPRNIQLPNDTAVKRAVHDIEAMPPEQGSPAEEEQKHPPDAIDEAIKIDEELDMD
jgi:hypothetical protein